MHTQKNYLRARDPYPARRYSANPFRYAVQFTARALGVDVSRKSFFLFFAVYVALSTNFVQS